MIDIIAQYVSEIFVVIVIHFVTCSVDTAK
jgi:hypothetical protein